MSVNLTINGQTFAYPETADTDWGSSATLWATAATNGMLQKAGGAFTLLADVNFGATFGLTSAYYKSRTADISTAGSLRLAQADSIGWRNQANSADLLLSVSTDALRFNGVALTLAGAIVNADISASAAIAYSKLALTGSIVNADISASAAIAYSKLALGTSIVNADISAGAAIAYSKLALGTSIVNADISASAAIAGSKIAPQFGNQIVSGDREYQFTEIATPGAPAANKVFLYPKADGNMYKMDDTGVEVQVGSGGSGTGTLNIVANPSATSGTTGFTAAASYTVTRNTTDSPLGTVVGTCFALSTTLATPESSTSGVYAASLANPTAIRNTKLQLSMYVTVPLSTLGVWRVSIYNSGGTRVALSTDSSSVTTLPSGFGGQFTASFDADSGATYTLAITQTTRSSANTLFATNISIGNGVLVQGSIVEPWETYTPTTQGFGTITSISVLRRRVGSSIEVQGQFTTGTVTADEARIGLPSGLTLTGTTGPSVIGKFDTSAVVSDNNHNVLSSSGLSHVTIARHNMQATATNMLLPAAGSAFTSSTSRVSFFFSAPIAEWAGGGTVNLGQNDIEYAFTTGTWDANSSATAYGPQGVQMTGALTDTRSKTVTWLSPRSVTDEISIELSRDGVSWTNSAALAPYSLNSTGSNALSGGIFLNASTTTTTDVSFCRYSAIANDDAPAFDWGTGFYWRVKKTKAGVAVGFGLAAAGNSGLINFYQTESGSLNNDFTGGTYITTRIGNVVTVTIKAGTHPSGAVITSTVGVPTWARPTVSDVRTVYTSMQGSFTGILEISTAGFITTRYYVSNGTTVNRTDIGYSAAISYTI